MIKIEKSTPKYGTRHILIDEEDLEIFNQYDWMLWSSPRHHSIYVVTTRSKKNGPSKRLHRLIMKAGPGQVVDHINGNALDNRKCNLRLTDSFGNNQNARKRKDAHTSQFKGVRKVKNPKSRKPWVVQMQHKYKTIVVGRFMTEIEAAVAYNTAAMELFGEFANLNKIPT